MNKKYVKEGKGWIKRRKRRVEVAHRGAVTGWSKREDGAPACHLQSLVGQSPGKSRRRKCPTTTPLLWLVVDKRPVDLSDSEEDSQRDLERMIGHLSPITNTEQQKVTFMFCIFGCKLFMSNQVIFNCFPFSTNFSRRRKYHQENN